jgi:hypothetical protein
MSLPMIKRKELPYSGLTMDWSNVPLNQMVQVSSIEFSSFNQWDLEFDKILKRAEELDAELVVYRMTPPESVKVYTLSDHYIFQFKPKQTFTEPKND